MTAAVDPRVAALVLSDGEESKHVVDAKFFKTHDVSPSQVLTVTKPLDSNSFSNDISLALGQLDSKIEWVWILRDTSVPDKSALKFLLSKLEESPSAAIAGPKQLRSDRQNEIVSLGISLSRWSEPLRLAAGEFDQGQHDADSDVLSVDLDGCLIRKAELQRHVLALGSIPSESIAYELGMRVRASGKRVLVQPQARHVVSVEHDPTSFRSELPRLLAWLHLAAVSQPIGLMSLFWLAIPLLIPCVSLLALLKKRPVQALVGPLALSWSLGTIPRRLASRKSLRSLGDIAVQRALWLDSGASRKLKGYKFQELRSTEADRPKLFASASYWLLLVPLIVSWQYLPFGAAQSSNFPSIGTSLVDMFETTIASSRPYWDGLPFAADTGNWVWLLFGLLSPGEPGLALSWLFYLAPALAMAISFRLFAEFSTKLVVAVALALGYALNPILVGAMISGDPVWLILSLLLPTALLSGTRAQRLPASQSWPWWALLGLALFGITALYPLAGLAFSLFAIGWWLTLQPQRLPRLAFVLTPSILLLIPFLVSMLGSRIYALATQPQPNLSIPPSLLQLLPLLIPLTIWGVSVASLKSLDGIVLALLIIAAISSFFVWQVSYLTVLSTLLISMVRLSQQHVADFSWKRLKVAGAGLASLAFVGSNFLILMIQPTSLIQRESALVPALVQASTEGAFETRTLVVRLQGEDPVVDLIWGDGRHLTDISSAYLLDSNSLGLDAKAKAAKLAASLLAGNAESAADGLRELSINFILLSDGAIEASRNLATIPLLSSSGTTEFGELWRVNNSPAVEKSATQLDVLEIALLTALGILMLLSLPRIRIAARSSGATPIFEDAIE